MSTVESYDSNEHREQQAVTMTPAAINHAKEAILKRGKGLGLRFGVKKSGCSGYSYVLDFVDKVQLDDRIFPFAEGLAVYVDAPSLAFVQGTELDYVKSELNYQFVFNNPNAQNACGCGESFNIDMVNDI